jgi:hypothetical protein
MLRKSEKVGAEGQLGECKWRQNEQPESNTEGGLMSLFPYLTGETYYMNFSIICPAIAVCTHRVPARTWISSITAASYFCPVSAISTVMAVCCAFSTSRFSCPVTVLQGTPAAFKRSAVSQASNRRGPQYTPEKISYNGLAYYISYCYKSDSNWESNRLRSN